MGYNKELFKVLKNITLKNKSIIELGSQDLLLPIDEINYLIHSWGGTPDNLNEYLCNNYSRLSSKYFYLNVGARDYKSIDIDGTYNSLIFDLNFNIKDKYNYNITHDIVTNIGTTEHVFDQKACFENIHDLCKTNGLMIHLLPISGHENHCFFNYHSTFFEHLAEVNNYEILYMDYYKTTYYAENDSEHIIVILKKNNSQKFNNLIQKSINQKRKIINKLNNLYEQRFKILTNLDFNTINNIAIFGTAKASEQAYTFALKTNKNIVCFIDDFKVGYYKNSNIPIVSFNEFIKKHQKEVDIIFQGNKQKGNLSLRKGLEIRIFELSNLIYSAYLH